MNILIFANGPGEVIERTLPLARILKSHSPHSSIFLVLTPCQFSSGNEKDIARRFSLFDGIFLLKGLFFPIHKFFSKEIDVVFHVGGDLLYPLFFSYILKAKLYSYGIFFIRSLPITYIVPFSREVRSAIKKGISLSCVFFGGNLSFSFPSTYRFKKKGSDWKIGIFPGSRKLQFEHLLPFFIKILEDLKKDRYKIIPKLFLSPFISIDFLKKVLTQGPTYEVLDYSLGTLYKNKDKYYILSDSNVKIEVEEAQEGIKELDFAITTPGTSTLTLSHFGIPMLVVAPLNKVEVIPLNGILNFVGYIPYIGPSIKKQIVYNYLRKKKFLALPNIIEDRELVDEIRGTLEASYVVERVKFLLSHKKDMYKKSQILIEFEKKYRLRKSKLIKVLKDYE